MELPFEADEEAACDLGVEGAGVACFFDSEDLLDPGDHLVGAGVGGLVEVDDAVLQVLGEGSFEGRGAGGDGGVVFGKHIHLFVVFEQQWPLGAVHVGFFDVRGDHVLPHCFLLLHLGLHFDEFLLRFLLLLVLGHFVYSVE